MSIVSFILLWYLSIKVYKRNHTQRESFLKTGEQFPPRAFWWKEGNHQFFSHFNLIVFLI